MLSQLQGKVKSGTSSAIKRQWTELCGVYPLRFKQLKNFSTGMFVNVFVSMARDVIPTGHYSKLQLGCQSVAGRLDEIYMVPSVRAANARFLNDLRSALRDRYSNEASFSL